MIINGVDFNADCYSVIEELRSQLAINKITLFHKIVDTSKNVQVCCPYHKDGQERRPSAGIKKSDGTFHCFACGETHSLPEVISYCFGHTEDMLGKWGWNWLLRNFATISVEERKDVELDLERSNSVSVSVINSINSNGHSVIADNLGENDKGVVSEEELDEYRYYHPYWTKRGIVDERIISLFDLGYDKQTDCITMPVRDAKGHTLFVARRSVKTKFFNYPKDVDKPLYGLYEYNLERSKLDHTFMCVGRGCGKTHMIEQIAKRFLNVFICESMIDALLLWQAGYFAFALNGLGSSKQIEDLKRLPIRQYILCTDNDKAGQNARKVLRDALQDNFLLTEIKFPSDRKDVGECMPEEIENILQWEVL